MSTTPSAPLAGIRVIDFSELLPGPFLSQTLVDMGAQVIKIERPPGGDNARSLVPGVYAAMNRGKDIRMLNLKDAAQRDEALTMIDSADVVLEGYRPGAMQRLGLGFEALSRRNPKLIYVSLSGFGQTGPFAAMAGHDINYLAAAGATALSGRAGEAPEHSYGIPVADLSGALYGLSSLLAALYQRQRTGRGQWLDVSITDCLVHMLNPRIGQFVAHDLQSLEAQRREALSRPAYGVFTSLDQAHVAIAAVEDHFWTRLVQALELPAEGLPQDYVARTDQAVEINRLLTRCIALLPAVELRSRLSQYDVPWCDVTEPNDLCAHPQLRARNRIQAIDTPLGKMHLSSFPVQLEGMA